MTIAKWFRISFPPIHNVTIFPFILGTFLAWRLDRHFSLFTFALGGLGAALILVSACHAGEYLNNGGGQGAGSRLMNRFTREEGMIRPDSPSRPVTLWTSVIAAILAGGIGVILQFGFKTGPLTLILGGVGTLGCFLYCAPARSVDKGFGELTLSACHGWLPVAAAFYIQKGSIAPWIHWMALPIALSIFNVLLLNGFSDPPAKAAVGKQSILVRLGKDKGTVLYVLISILSWFFMVFSCYVGIPRKAVYFYLPVIALSAVACFMMTRKKYESPFARELLCGLNIAVNLGTTAAFLLAYL